MGRRRVGRLSTARLDRGFFRRSALDVAPDLLGKLIVVGARSLRINETEAYLADDAASHSFRGETARNRIMFGEAGHCYVYFIYGMHFCVNVVTGGLGDGQAVLLRGGEPVEGIERMRTNRPKAKRDRDLANGPGKLAAALGVTAAHNGRDFCDDDAFCFNDDGFAHRGYGVSPRIGITKNPEPLWRFVSDHGVEHGVDPIAGTGQQTRPNTE